MASKTFYVDGGNFTLSSSFTAYSCRDTDNSTKQYYTHHGGSETLKYFYYGYGIPYGSTIHSANVYYDVSTGTYGGSAGPGSGAGAPVDLNGQGWSHITFTWRTNTGGGYPSIPGTKGTCNSTKRTGTATFSNVRVVVNYTLPYTKCTPPTSFSFSANNVAPGATSRVSWSGASGGTNNAIKQYKLYRSTSSGGTYSHIATTTNTYYDVAAPTTNGSSYYYKVITVGNVAGYDSGYSAASGALTCSFTSPSTPTGVAVSSTNVKPSTSVTLSWNASTGGTNNALTGYQIQRAPAAGGPWSVLKASQTGRTLTVTAQASNASWFYRVYALAPHANSAASAVVELKTVFTAPSTPSNVGVSPASVGKGGSSTLSWTASSNGTNNDVSGYRIERATASSGPWTTIIASQTATSLALTGQTANNTSYFYRVIALAPYAESNVSATAQLKTEWTAPPTPSEVTLSTNDVAPSETVVLSWNASSDGVNNKVSGYRIERSTSATIGFETLVATQPETTLDVVARNATGQAYYFRITALAPQQNSAVSATVELRTSVGPIAVPTNLLLNDATSSTVSPVTTVSLTWTASPDGENNAITGYKIYEATSAAGTYAEIGSVGRDITSFDIITQTDAGTRYYKIAAIGTHSNSNQTGYVSITVSLTTADASTFSMAPSSVNAGTTTTATIVAANSAFTHKIWITFGTKTSTIGTLEAQTPTWAYEVPMDWLYEIPNALTGSAVVTLETYSGTILKGRRTSNIVITVPTGVVPTLDTFVGNRVDNLVPSDWGVYVVSKSQVDLVMGEGSGAYGSSITNYRLQGGGMNITNSQPISQRSPVLTATSTTYTATVTDSRGRSNSYTVTVNAEPYSAPTLSATTFRCNNLGDEIDDGTYGYVNATSQFSSIAGKNSVTIESMYRPKGSTAEYTVISNSMTSGVGIVFGNGTIELEKYYEVLYIITDAVGTEVRFADEISVAMYILHFRKTGLGLGIGGPSSDDNTLDIHWNTRFHGGVELGDAFDVGDLFQKHNVPQNNGSILDPKSNYIGTRHNIDSVGAGFPTDNGQTWHFAGQSGEFDFALYKDNGGDLYLGGVDPLREEYNSWRRLVDSQNIGQFALPVVGGTMSNQDLVTNLNADLLDEKHASNSDGDIPVNNGILNTNLNADLLDGKHASNSDGDIPVNNGVLNTNLNSDMLDGKHASNAAEDIPISNGTLNTDLNADKLDGYHASDIALLSYPVGAIYMSVVSTSPATLFGGTWAALGGRMLIGVDTTYTNGLTGGAATHTHTTPNHSHTIASHTHTTPNHNHTTATMKLTVAQMPSHSHKPKTPTTATGGGVVTGFDFWRTGGGWGSTSLIQSTGGGGAHGHGNTGNAAPTTNANTAALGTGNAAPTTNAGSSLPPYLAVHMWKRTA